MRKYSDLYLDTRQGLLRLGCLSAAMEARELVCAASGKTREQLVSDYPKYVSDAVEQKTAELLGRRLEGEPLAYIIGEWEFYGLRLTVTRDVLIPRDDSEVLAAKAIACAKETAGIPRVLDLCAGTGCIGLAVASKVPSARVVLADISPAATAICKANAKRNSLSGRTYAVEADALKPVSQVFGQFDVIVCNPPYISAPEMEALDPSVRLFEPHLALYGGADGLDFYRSVAQNWKRALKSGGKLLFEIGMGQAGQVSDILLSQGYEVLEILKDTQEIERVIISKIT